MLRSIFALGVLALLETGAAARAYHINVQLIAESPDPAAGGSILLGVRMIPQRGWHRYWSNPGESGLAPKVEWAAPPGVRVGPLQHPAPTLLRVMGVTSYVHAGTHLLLARMTLDRKLPRGTVLPISANLSWAACSDRLCVPETARLSLRLKVGNGSRSAGAGLLRAALAREPRPISGGSFTVKGKRVVLKLPAAAMLQPARTRFFPDENGYWDPDKAEAVGTRPLSLSSVADSSPPRRITGVVSDGSTAYRVTLRRAR